jgi:hypothetical protein
MRRHHHVLLWTGLLVVSLAAGCSGDGDRDVQENVPENRNVETTAPQADRVTDPPPCAELFAEGARTDASSEAVREGVYCTNNGTEQLVRSTVSECTDGRTVVSNEWGWGFDGEGWHAVTGDVGAAADAACTGTGPTG